MKKAVIITSYIENPFDMKQASCGCDFIICTDGGYDIAVRSGITPDLFLGDFDSLDTELAGDIPVKRFNPEKDYTDLELAIKTCAEKSFSAVEVWGGIGGRLDHTVANLQILSHYSRKFDSLTMFDGKNKCFVLYGPETIKIDPDNMKFTVSGTKPAYLSLFSLSERCEGVTISGVKYPLADHVLTNTFPLGVSNEFKDKNAALSVKSGTLLVIFSRD